MAGLLLLEKMSQPTPYYLVPHKNIDSIAGSIHNVPDDLRSIENFPVLQMEILLDDNIEHNTKSPLSSPLVGKILSPEQDPHKSDLSLVSRIEIVENQMVTVNHRLSNLEQKVDQLSTKLDLVVSALAASLPSATGLPPSTSSPTVLEFPTVISPEPSKSPAVSQASSSSVITTTNVSPVLRAWKGTNSQIKAVASRSTPVKPKPPAIVMATVKMTTTPSIKASDPSRAAEGEPKAHVIPARRSKQSSLPSTSCHL